MTEPRSSDEIDRASIEEQRGYFAHHEIRDRSADESRWTLVDRRPDGQWNSNLWCEIAVLKNNTLVVHGDFEMCMWSGGGASDAVGTVAWIGRQSGLVYVKQKARMALDSSELTEEWSAEALRCDLMEYVADYPNSYGEEMVGDMRGAFDDAIEGLADSLDDCDCDGVIRGLLDDGHVDSECVGSWGRVTTLRVIRAWVAVARLHELLLKERGEA